MVSLQDDERSARRPAAAREDWITRYVSNKSVKTHAETSSQSRGFWGTMRAKPWWMRMAAANVKMSKFMFQLARKEADMGVPCAIHWLLHLKSDVGEHH